MFLSIIFDTCISDHKTVCIDLDLPKPTVHKTTFLCRQLKKIDTSEFNKDIAAAFSYVENVDLNSHVKFFNSTLTLKLDKHAPLKLLQLLLVIKIHGSLLTS